MNSRNFANAVRIGDFEVGGSGNPGNDDRIGEIADAVLAVVPAWDQHPGNPLTCSVGDCELADFSMM